MNEPFSLLSFPQISSFLLDLHRSSNELAYRELLTHCLDRLKTLLPFDSGLFGMGTIREGIPQGHDVMLYQQPPEFLASWEHVKHQDRIAFEAFSSPDRTVNRSLDDGVFEGCDAMLEHGRRWGLDHILCTGTVLLDAGIYWVMSLYRALPSPPFSEAERATNELLVPHIIAATRQARLTRMRAVTQHTEDYGPVAAVVDREGVVLEAEPGLIELLRLEWPGWMGPWLPADLIERLRAPETAQRVVLRRLVVRSDEVDGMRLVHVRRVVVADRLTARERQIAEAFSTGDSYREIGERLTIAPNTVRRHLANIYEKLGISSKVELDRMLGGLG
jgi:DNA-binding CsgD family transcriptional regulator